MSRSSLSAANSYIQFAKDSMKAAQYVQEQKMLDHIDSPGQFQDDVHQYLESGAKYAGTMKWDRPTMLMEAQKDLTQTANRVVSAALTKYGDPNKAQNLLEAFHGNIDPAVEYNLRGLVQQKVDEYVGKNIGHSRGLESTGAPGTTAPPAETPVPVPETPAVPTGPHHADLSQPGGMLAYAASIYGDSHTPDTNLPAEITGGSSAHQDQVKSNVNANTDTDLKLDNVPGSVVVRAAAVALQGGAQAVQHFMAAEGHPKSGNWCGEFAAAVVESVGGTPPRNPEVASNWRNYGTASTPQNGAVAVRRVSLRGGRVPTGETGSHVTFVQSVDPRTGTFIGVGGNQGGTRSRFRVQDYDFRTSGGA
jgi:hypothetical protein